MSEMNNVSEKSRLSETSHTVKISTRELCAIAWSNERASVWATFNSSSSEVQGRDARNFKGKDII